MAKTNKRILSIDALRGLTVLGMVLCASIGFNSGLPAWMFHAQTPPPTYAFNPDIAGLTWVDLVFPFFLFPLGAAFPLAMRKKLENGASKGKMLMSLLKRWVILVCFALVLGNSYDVSSSAREAWCSRLFMIAMWASLFLALVRIKNDDSQDAGVTGWLKRHRSGIINLTGAAAIIGLGFIKVNWFEVPVSIYSNDIIMMILANVALFGGAIWMFTRNNMTLRWVIFGIIALIKALSSYCPQVLSFIPDWNWFSWCFKWEFLQYLLIAIPGSIVGDYLLDKSVANERPSTDWRNTLAGFIAFAAVVLQLWGIQTRNVLADLIISIIMAGIFLWAVRGRKDTISMPGILGFVMMIVGIIFDPIDGGITKDYCNIAYLLTTGGMASLMISFFIMLDEKFGVGCKILVLTGQNPMVAYTVTSFLIIPILSMLGIMDMIYGAAAGSMFWGLMQGFILTGLMTAVTCFLTKVKVFWRS